jgi:Flp pilus assembly protein TadD
VAREVARAHPDDWRAQMLLARALHDGDEARAAFTRMCELAAQNPALVTPCPAR